jgi:hypothetical protein
MAELTREGDELVVHLTRAEHVEGLHGDLRFPASSVRTVNVLDDAMAAVHGIRAPGTGVPGIVKVGTYHGRRHTTFVAVHHDTPRGVRVTLQGVGYTELIVGCHEPETVAGLVTGVGTLPDHGVATATILDDLDAGRADR